LIKPVTIVTHKAIFVAVLAGQNTGARRSANRVGTKRILKQGAFFGDAIDVGRGCYFGQRSAVRRNRIDGVIVRKDEQHIRPIARWLDSVMALTGTATRHSMLATTPNKTTRMLILNELMNSAQNGALT